VDATHVAIAKPMELSKQLQKKYNYATDRSANLPFIKIDKERITSTEALKLKEVPKHLLVVVLLELN
jgi:dihydrolipoamide dehydrogenase